MGANKERAERVILEILRQAGTEGLGKTKLYKAFWLAHLYFARENPGFLSDWPIVRMPNGAGIDKGEMLLRELVENGQIALEQGQAGPLPVCICRSVDERPSGIGAREIAAIKEAVE